MDDHIDPEDVFEEKIAQAQAAITAMADQYVPVLQDQVAQLESLVAEARACPADNAALIRLIFGIAHNIKGQGGSFGFHLITDIGASLSDMTEEHSVFGADEIDIIDAHLQAMHQVIAEDIRGDGGEAGAALIARLRTMSRSVES